ncbi:MAG: hypothetical protein LBD97_07800 [Bifidobacteriaceae bacterium]|jgi:hypothetical protein|nr:hypothetical protein [Bifidobacteriaceae bacterium]
MKRFAKAFANLVSSSVRAGSVAMENQARKLSDYATRQEQGEKDDSAKDD